MARSRVARGRVARGPWQGGPWPVAGWPVAGWPVARGRVARGPYETRVSRVSAVSHSLSHVSHVSHSCLNRVSRRDKLCHRVQKCTTKFVTVFKNVCQSYIFGRAGDIFCRSGGSLRHIHDGRRTKMYRETRFRPTRESIARDGPSRCSPPLL